MLLSLHRCKICGTRWLLWPDAIHGGGWNLLDKWQCPGSCCDNVAMGDQIEHLRDFDLSALPASASPQAKGEPKIGTLWRDNDERQKGRLVDVVGVWDGKVGYRSAGSNRLAYSRLERFLTAFTEQSAFPASLDETQQP